MLARRATKQAKESAEDRLMLFIDKESSNRKSQESHERLQRVPKEDHHDKEPKRLELCCIMTPKKALSRWRLRAVLSKASSPSVHHHHHHKPSVIFSFCLIIIALCHHYHHHHNLNPLPNFIMPASAQELPPQSKSLPTVIVRGFLNYRTTVDGTVLLFTPDAGQSQAASSSLAVVPSSTLAPTPPLSTKPPVSSGGRQQQVVMKPLAEQQAPGDEPFSERTVEPTSVQLAGSLAFSFATASPFDSPTADDEWRPIQATPPLKPAASPAPNLLATQPSVQADDAIAVVVAQSDNSANSPPEPAKSSPESSTEQQQPVSLPVAKPAKPGRARRPGPNFSAQSARARTQSDSSVDTTPSLSPGNGRGSINGIRRPGLPASASSSSLAPASDGTAAGESPAAAADAFQSRLNKASTRMRNRFKHRHPSSGILAMPANQTNTGTAIAAELSGSSVGAGAGAGGLDVASSVEAPQQSPHPLAALSQSAVLGKEPSAPVVGSDEVIPNGSSESSSTPAVAADVSLEAAGTVVGQDQQQQQQAANQDDSSSSPRRVGELRPAPGQSSKAQIGELQQGTLSSGPLNLDVFFQNDQPPAGSSLQPAGEQVPPSEHQPSPSGPRPSFANKNNNDKLNNWLGQHHNKFVPRPPPSERPHKEVPLPGGRSNAIILSDGKHSDNTTSLIDLPPSNPAQATNSSSKIPDQQEQQQQQLQQQQVSGNGTGLVSIEPSNQDEQQNLQTTITRTYSTVISASKTRLVPMQVKSSTAIFTITEDYVMTKMLTAYQTLPQVGEFILPEPTRAPYEVFSTGLPQEASESKAVAAPPAAVSHVPAAPNEEQPISLQESDSAKSTNDWLHDFNSPSANNDLLDSIRSSSQQQTSPLLAGLLADPQQQQQQLVANNLLAGLGFPNQEFPGDQLAASSQQLDPAQLLADGSISIPDLNNPLVLAAAIQNPQLAAVILAAQQLQLKQRQQKGRPSNGLQSQQQQLVPIQLQPSYSTSLSTTIKQSTYTMRDTMYTTRLVSFRDGRTVRTRTVSEPGSVIEQTLTTMVTETIPVTITIKPTASFQNVPATSLPNNPAASNSQATINNALFATQLAQILARRQQQLQTSFATPPLGQQQQQQQQATPQQLVAVQQLLNQQRSKQNQQQFQPNLQQLLQSMQNNATNHSQAVDNQPFMSTSTAPTPALSGQLAQQPRSGGGGQANPQQQAASANSNNPAVAPNRQASGPITTTLTSLQVRTYTVHNAFKTIFRTITSTVLIPTVLTAQQATMIPFLG